MWQSLIQRLIPSGSSPYLWVCSPAPLKEALSECESWQERSPPTSRSVSGPSRLSDDSNATSELCLGPGRGACSHSLKRLQFHALFTSECVGFVMGWGMCEEGPILTVWQAVLLLPLIRVNSGMEFLLIQYSVWLGMVMGKDNQYLIKPWWMVKNAEYDEYFNTPGEAAGNTGQKEIDRQREREYSTFHSTVGILKAFCLWVG